MAKQTYTTGQVLTAAQMTTLQTNDFNQTVSAKTASYTLVAADAGTRITMSNASATTVTVNTAIFAAGDTLEITNIGAGICTVTAGSATVSTSSTLALKQFDTGQLYFTSTGVAIFFMADAADAGGSPLTTKGDLYTFSTVDARLAVGTNGQVLTADSSEATGLKYTTPAAGALVFIQRSTFSSVASTTTTFDGIFTSTYSSYIVIIENFFASTAADDMLMKIRIGATDGPGTYAGSAIITVGSGTTVTAVNTAGAGPYMLSDQSGSSTEPTRGQLDFPLMGASGSQMCTGQFSNANAGRFSNFNGTNYAQNAYTGLQFLSSSSNISGTISVYGLVKS